MKRGKLIVISGPSGVGKDTVIKELLKKLPLNLIRTATTREKRGDEDYIFLGREEFLERIERGEFVEWAEVYGNIYGIPREELERALEKGDSIVRVDVQGAMTLMKKFPDSVFIFLSPPSVEELERRLKTRGREKAQELERRLEVAKREMEASKYFRHVVVNDKLEETVKKIIDIISEE